MSETVVEKERRKMGKDGVPLDRRVADRRTFDAAVFDAWLRNGGLDRRSGMDRRSGLDRRGTDRG